MTNLTYTAPSKVLSHADRIAAWGAGERPAPVTVEFDLSNRCSLGCQACHFAHTHTKGPWAERNREVPSGYTQGGDLADPDMVVRVLGEMAEAGVLAIIWSGGGEPTLHPQWRRILRVAHEVGLSQGMYTLGGHIDKEDAELLATVASWVVVSLDCPDADTYAAEKGVAPDRFDAACRGISLMAEAGVTAGASFLLHAGNVDRIDEMVDLGRLLGATYVSLRPTIHTSPAEPGQPLDDRAWIDEKLLSYLGRLSEQPDIECDPGRFRQYRDWSGHGYNSCYGIRFNATVTPDGRVWVCPQRRGVEGSCIGSLAEQSFADLWEGHPGEWTDFSGCRAMCRLHLTNQVLDQVYVPRVHSEFI